MKCFYVCLATAMLLYSCGDAKKENTITDKNDKAYAAGDRRGADTSMKDIAKVKDIATLICQRWDNKEDFESTQELTDDDKLEIPVRSFYFFNDSTVVKNARDKVLYGTWSYSGKDKKIDMSFEDGKKETQYIMAISYQRLSLQNGNGEEAVKIYQGDGFVNKNNMNDPFFKPNLEWRIKPAAPESDAAILKRIKGQIHFFDLFFSDAYRRNAAVISYYGLPTCFKWYAGGITLTHQDELNKNWKNIFYDTKDVAKAYIIVDKLISKKYNWNEKENNWVKQDAGVLKQMEAKLDSL